MSRKVLGGLGVAEFLVLGVLCVGGCVQCIELLRVCGRVCSVLGSSCVCVGGFACRFREL